MAIYKCKMCGGDLEIAEGVTIAECEYCGTKQTVPKAIDENLQNLFNRANTLRIKSEFDKAEKIYEKIIQADSTQSEAYWGLILCKYGIEYVDDPATFKKIPTCHRASYDSIIADDDYKSAIANADMSQRAVYEEQAKEIDRIQKDILALAQKEETYDVFICYKETDANGKRTQDSVIANDIYYQLKQEGFKVFYAAITLEGKLGSAYEPIIFAALNSAKVMLAIGTKPDYFNAVWVKNEWSRYLKIIKKDRSKLLIPCYRDMDAYELPEEFAHLQAQDMSKIGFINDVVRGIKKVIKKDEPKATVVKETVVQTANANTAPLLKRAFMFLEDGDWKSANEYCEKVLDQDPENAEAYLGKLMVELGVQKKKQLRDCDSPFDTNSNYKKVMRYGSEDLKTEMRGITEHIKTRNKKQKIEAEYNDIMTQLSYSAVLGSTVEQYEDFAKRLAAMGDYKDAQAKSKECYEKARIEAAKEAEKQKAKKIKRKKRKICTVVVIICLIIVLGYFYLPWKTIFDSVQAEITGLSYTLNDDGNSYSVSGIDTYTATDIVIPSTYKGLPVTSIGEDAFSGCTALESITIPDSVTSIGEDAFEGCTSLNDVYYTGNVEGWLGISLSGYYGPMYYGANLYFDGKLVTSVVIPDSVTSIGKYAFVDCTSLTSVTIPDSVKSIGNSAFSNCTSLTSVTIGNSVTSIDSFAFYSCESLKSVTIGNSVTSIADYAFSNCTSLESITIPDSVTSIGARAFYGCTSLESITIPDSVTELGGGAFEGCSSLIEVRLGKGITNLAAYKNSYLMVRYTGMFEDCISLSKIIIPDSVTSIDSRAFYNCTSLTSVTIGNSVTSIDSFAFYSCESLKSVTIGNSVTSIADYAFSNCTSLESITIPDSVTSIGARAFYGCTSLESITIPDSVTSIDKDAFYNCTSLESITIPDSVTELGGGVFEGCTVLESVTIGDSVTSIGDDAFSGCSSLTTIIFEGTIPEYSYSDIPNLSTIVLKDGVTSIGNSAFYYCTSLTSITIPDSVKSIGESAFLHCRSLTSVTIGDSVTSIGDDAFRHCTSLTSTTIPDSVTELGGGVFAGCTVLESVTIGDSVTSIGDWAFYGCTSLESITIPDSVTSIGSSAFYNCTSLESVTIGDSVTSIGEWAFYDCTSLTSITIPDTVTSIGYSAFRSCTSLTSITIPDSVTSIDRSAFYYCTSLTSVTFENTAGWRYASSSSATSETSISATGLSNPATAAIYLTGTYCDYDWKRS